MNLNFINHQKFLCKTLTGNSGTLRKIQKAGGLHFKNYAKLLEMPTGVLVTRTVTIINFLRFCWLPTVTLNLQYVFCD